MDVARRVELRCFEDERGVLRELYHPERGLGIPEIGQTLCSTSRTGVYRGLHYQWPKPMGKLIVCLRGVIQDVVVDIRRSSPDFGRVFSFALRGNDRTGIWVPRGYAHGFMVEETATVLYFCDEVYDAQCDRAIQFIDPSLKILRPPKSRPFLVSPKDAAAPLLCDVPPQNLPE